MGMLRQLMAYIFNLMHRIGPEMTSAAMRVLEASSAPLEFEVVDNVVDTLTPEVLESFRKNKVALKGEFQVGAYFLVSDEFLAIPKY